MKLIAPLLCLLASVTLALACSACGPAAPEPPYVSEVLSYVGEGRYEIRAEPLASLRRFDQLDGEVARFRGGGFVRLERALGAATEPELRRALAVQRAHDVQLDYERRAGVVRAVDYDTFAMLTLYRAIERTRGFFLDAGLRPGELGALPVYFRPRLEVFLFPLLASNNAVYAAPADAFLFFNDFLEGAEVPLALNLGVVAHEYAHAVWQHLVWGDRLAPWATETWPDVTVNHARALDEGVADVFGATLTDDPRFVGRSVADLASSRDLAEMRTVTADDVARAEAEATSFDPYPLGSIVAGALWAAGASTGRGRLLGHLLEAQRALAGGLDRSFRIPVMLDRVVAAAEPAHREALCAAFTARLSALGPVACCEGRCP